MATERTLTRRELNRALLARQLLLGRATTPIPRTLERIGGIQAQYAPSMYIGLWSRLEDLERDAVTRALERRGAVQGTLMRATIEVAGTWRYEKRRVNLEPFGRLDRSTRGELAAEAERLAAFCE